MKILVGISGASGAHLGLRLASQISKLGEQCSVIMTEGAKEVLKSEMDFKFELSKDIQIWDAKEISAPPASGSALFDSLIIAPCSVNTLAKISCGFCDNLLTRAACVMLKERRKLVLCVRETPFSPIALKQMAELSALGVVIAPPMLGYYHSPNTLEEMENFVIGKWLDALGLKHDIFTRWGQS